MCERRPARVKFHPVSAIGASKIPRASMNLGTACHQRGELQLALASYERGERLAKALDQSDLLLVLAFGRTRDALIIMANLPLALIGGVAGVFLSGGVLNVATMMGLAYLDSAATRPRVATARYDDFFAHLGCGMLPPALLP